MPYVSGNYETMGEQHNIKFTDMENTVIEIEPDEENDRKGKSLLTKLYDMVLEGVPLVSEPVTDLVRSYTDKYGYTEKAIDKLVKNQIAKCATTGFITGLGGLLTLPITISADLASSLYIELRMIVAIAIIRGYNPHDDAVKTAAYLCLVGNTASAVLNDAGIKVMNALAYKKLLPLLNRKVTARINRAIGRRIVTKAGSKGIVNASKLVPVAGGLFSAAYNFFEVKAFAKIAKARFNRE